MFKKTTPEIYTPNSQNPFWGKDKPIDKPINNSIDKPINKPIEMEFKWPNFEDKKKIIDSYSSSSEDGEVSSSSDEDDLKSEPVNVQKSQSTTLKNCSDDEPVVKKSLLSTILKRISICLFRGIGSACMMDLYKNHMNQQANNMEQIYIIPAIIGWNFAEYVIPTTISVYAKNMYYDAKQEPKCIYMDRPCQWTN